MIKYRGGGKNYLKCAYVIYEWSLRGPNKLEIIDLSSTKFVPQDTAQSQDSKPENDFPLSNIKMLNLSDSLINLDDAMEILGLSLMYNLSEVKPYFSSLSVLNQISPGPLKK